MPVELQAASTDFTTAIAELQRMPIRTPGIDRWVREAQAQWTEMLPFQRGQGSMRHCVEVCQRLLDVMGALTEAYDRRRRC